MGAPPLVGGSGPRCSQAAAVLPTTPGTSLDQAPLGHNHVWQEAQCLLWGLRMVGNRWEGWGRGGRELGREAWWSLWPGPGRYCEGGERVLSDCLGQMEMEDPGGWGASDTRLFLTVPWVQSSREFRGRSWRQCDSVADECVCLCHACHHL